MESSKEMKIIDLALLIFFLFAIISTEFIDCSSTVKFVLYLCILIFIFVFVLLDINTSSKIGMIFSLTLSVFVILSVISLCSIFFPDKLHIYKNYYLYMVSFVGMASLLFLHSLNNLIKDTRKKSMENRGNIGGILDFIFLWFVCLILPIYQTYQPKNIISLNNLKMPSKIQIYNVHILNSREKSKDGYDHSDYLISEHEEMLTEITDKKEIEDIFKSIPNTQVENIRNFNIFKYKVIKENHKDFIKVVPLYKFPSGDTSTFDDLEKGYIHHIEIFDNYSAVPYFKPEKDFFHFYRHNPTYYYNLPLSVETIEKLKNFYFTK